MDNERQYETGPGGSPRSRFTGDVGNLLSVVNGVVACVGGVYLMTRSVTITVLAGCVALVLAGLIVAKG